MEDPDRQTLTDDEEDEALRKKDRVGRILAITGALLQLGSVAAYFALVGVVANFRVDIDRISRAGTLADAPWVGYAIYGGFALGAVGFILLLLALMRAHYRARWFFFFLLLYGALLTAAAPFIPIGAVFVVYCLVRFRDFFPRRDRQEYTYDR